jgi:ubiquinone/menaquinone biosynthesis C-methylase UbiE
MADMSTALIQLLDIADALPWATELRTRTYDLLGRGRVVDVGCGTGRAVAELLERGSDPVGIDPSEEMISAARERWRADFRIGDAYSLPFADGEVTGYRADKVFHVLESPDRALAEARRVLAPDGRIVLVGQDWDGVMIDSADPVRTREIVHARADGLPNPRVARSYRNLLLDNGFDDVAVEAHTVLFTDPAMLPLVMTYTDDADWIAEQTERASAGRLFLAIPIFLASGRLPG